MTCIFVGMGPQTSMNKMHYENLSQNGTDFIYLSGCLGTVSPPLSKGTFSEMMM